MDLTISLKKILKKGTISDEAEFEKASILDRKLRLLVKEFPELKNDRQKLRMLLKAYEDKNWSREEITDEKVLDSEFAVQLAEQERVFIDNRKNSIKLKLKELGLSQKDLAAILGHKSATYMSELMNGINPFTLNDLIVIHRLLNIELESLVPTMLTGTTLNRLSGTIEKLNNPKLTRHTKAFTLGYP